MTTISSAWSRLRQHLHTTQLLGGIHSTLYFDQNTAMPAAASGWRGEQLALLARQLHERQSSPVYSELLEAAEAELPADAPVEQRHHLRLLRRELELALLEEGLPVAELPAAWNRGMEELLGLRPDSDAEGCLQDVHWSEGLFGYFPSYALGHLISAQLSEALEQELGAIETALEDGRDAELGQWLQQRVYPLGRSVNATQLVEQVSGRPLSSDPFLAYLEHKLERLAA